MERTRLRKYVRWGAALGAVAGAVGAFLAFGPPGLYHQSETPEFCASCHVMRDHYETWRHSGAHAGQRCVDCHLPNDDLPRHLFWKAVDGTYDLISFHAGLFSEPIRLSAHGAEVVQGNCRRCHATAVERIDATRRCWQCHRRTTHLHTGALATRAP